MGLFDFVKSVGQKLGIGDDTPDAGDLKKSLEKHKLGTEKVEIAVKGDTAVVKGQVADQATYEKVILALGNTMGIGKVDAGGMTVAQAAPKPAAQAAPKPAAQAAPAPAAAQPSVASGAPTAPPQQANTNQARQAPASGAAPQAAGSQGAGSQAAGSQGGGSAPAGQAGGTAQAGAQQQAAAPAQPVFYVVKKGDNLWKIAEAHYGKGEGAKHKAIFEANRPLLKDPDEIYPGQTLRIPHENEAA